MPAAMTLCCPCEPESFDSSVVQGERGRDLGEAAEPLFEMETGSSSSSESVLTGGVAI